MNDYSQLASNVPSIMLCLPQRDEVKAGFSMALSQLAFWNSRNMRANIYASEYRSSQITSARNTLVDKGLGFGVDWFFWIDSDMRFPPDSLVRLMKANKAMVGATYNKRTPPHTTLGHFIKKDLDRDIAKGGLIEADFMPGGLMLIKADVYRSMEYPWYFETYHWNGKSPLDSFVRMLQDWSTVEIPDSVLSSLYSIKGIREWLSECEPPEWMKKTRLMSEDYNFCRKVRRRGFEIWCDLDLTYEVGHIGEHIVTCERPPVGTTARSQPAETADV